MNKVQVEHTSSSFSETMAMIIYLLSVVAAVGLCCYLWAFSSHSRLGFFFAVVRGLLFAGASPGAEGALWGTRGSGTADVGAVVPSPGSRAQAQ